MELSTNKKILIKAGPIGPTGTFIIPESVTEIGHRAFIGYIKLTSIIVPERVTQIGAWAFKDCTGLINISIHDRVTRIGSCAFSGCTQLSSIIIPKGVTMIGIGAFHCCTGLISISIPDQVTTISHHAFKNCTSLTSLFIPEGIKEIAGDAFEGCTKLQNIVINTTNRSEFERINQLLRRELKPHVVPMSVYAQAKQLKARLLDDFCNHTSGINPLDGHERLPADVVGVISAFSDQFSLSSRLKKALNEVLMPTNDIVSEYESYEKTLQQVQASYIELIPLYVELAPLYGMRYHLLKYQQIMETPSEKPSSVRPMDFFGGQRPNVPQKYLSTWIRHQALTKILNWIEKIIDSNLLLADVPDLALSEEEKAAIGTSQLLMKGGFIPADFDFKAMIENKPPCADAGTPAFRFIERR